MGWVKYPTLFTALSETAVDLGNASIQEVAHIRPHCHDLVADTNTKPAPVSTQCPMQLRRQVPTKPPVGFIDVYVRNFIGLSQNSSRRFNQILSLLLHTVDQIFRPLNTLDPKHRKDPISTNNILKGDGALETTKLILGWIVEIIAGTIQLQDHCADFLHEIICIFAPDRKRASINSCYKLLRGLCSMVLSITGGLGIFSTLQDALSRVTPEGYIRLT